MIHLYLLIKTNYYGKQCLGVNFERLDYEVSR